MNKEIQLEGRTGYMRLSEVLELIPVSKSAWWDGIRSGIYPKGRKVNRRSTGWKNSDIDALIVRIDNEELL